MKEGKQIPILSNILLIPGIICALLFISGCFALSRAQWIAPNLIYPFPYLNWETLGWLNFSYPQLSENSYLYSQEFPVRQSTGQISFGGESPSTLFYPSLFYPLSPAGANFSLFYNALNTLQSIFLDTFVSHTAAFTLPAPEIKPVGIETRQIKYKPPAIQSAGLKYIPGLPAYAANQVIIQFLPGTPLLEASRVFNRHQISELYTSPYAGYTLVRTSSSASVLEYAQRLRTERSILFAEPNYYRHSHFIPNDPYYQYQWHLSLLNCSYAWDIETGAGAVVALLDSGVAYETSGIYAQAPDLAGTLFAPGYDFVNDDPFPDDDYSHGTHMAGCIAQTSNNLLGAAGVAFGATIMPVKVMDNIGGVTIADEVEGIYFATNNGAHIISMSLGGAGTSVTEAEAITYAYNNGTTIICSAGNSGSGTPEYPASYPEPVSVSAIRTDYSFASSYSNYGIYVDVCAPGGDSSIDLNADGFGDGILQQTHDGQNFSVFSYYFYEGTSPAAALVSGVAALIIGKSSIPLAPSDVVSILEGSATDLGTAGWDQYYGHGLVNAYLAVVQTP